MPIDGETAARQAASAMTLVHGTCVAIDGIGVLLRGAPGSGKSDLALRLLQAGGALVADDQVQLEECDGRLWAASPPPLRGLLEVRGVGVVRMPAAGRAPLRLLVDLVPRQDVPRLPEPAVGEVAGVDLPLFRLHAFDAATPDKIALLARALVEDIIVDR